jgi:hypothetical protein
MGHKTDLRDLSKHSPRRQRPELWSDQLNMTQPQARQVKVETLPANVDAGQLPDAPPPVNPVDDIVRTQREFRHRTVTLQHCKGQPIHNRPKPDSAVIKTLRKMLKKARRMGLVVVAPPPDERDAGSVGREA